MSDTKQQAKFIQMEKTYLLNRLNQIDQGAGGGLGRGNFSGRGNPPGRGSGRLPVPPSSVSSSNFPPASSVSEESGSVSKKIKLEPKASSGRSGIALPVMVPSPQLENSTRYSFYSIVKDQLHSADVVALNGEPGGALRAVSTAPRETCGSIVMSNVPEGLTLRDFAILSDHFTLLLPEGSRALQQVGGEVAKRILPGGVHSLLVLNLIASTVSSIPAERRSGSSVLPSLVFFPREVAFDVEHGYHPPAIVVTYVPRAVADSILRGRMVGAVRCYSWHSTDVSLNCLMIQRVLRARVPQPMRSPLLVVPFILQHPSTLPMPEGCEICYHVVYGATTVPPAVLSALFHSSARTDIAAFIGEIHEAELPFLLVDDQAKLLGLPFDERLVSDDLVLPRGRLAFSLKVPTLARYDIGYLLAGLLMAWEGVAPSLVNKAVSSIVRLSKQTEGFVLLVKEALPLAMVTALSATFPGSSVLPLTAIPSETCRSVLLSSLKQARSPGWWGSWVRALPQETPRGFMTAPPPGPAHILEAEIRRLDSLLEPLSERIFCLSSSVDSLGQDSCDFRESVESQLEDFSLRLTVLEAEVMAVKELGASLVRQQTETEAKLLRQAEENALRQQENLVRQQGLLEASFSERFKALERRVSSVVVGQAVVPNEIIQHGAPLVSGTPGTTTSSRLDPAGGTSAISQPRTSGTGSRSSASSPHSEDLEVDEVEEEVAVSTPLFSFGEPVANGRSFAEVLRPTTMLPWPSQRAAAIALEGLLGNRLGCSLDGIQGESFSVGGTPWAGAQVCAGLSPSSSQKGDTFTRITLLCATRGWGVSVLIPLRWAVISGVLPAEGCWSECPIILHQMLPDDSPVAYDVYPPYWSPTALPFWTTLHTEESVQSLGASPHYCITGLRRYAFPASNGYVESLPRELVAQAISIASPHLQALQAATSMAQAAVALLLVEVGAYSVSFTKQVQAATALALHARARSEVVLSERALLALNCNVTVRAVVAAVESGLGAYSCIHAFAEGRWRAGTKTRGAKPPHFLVVQNSKRAKAEDSARTSFLKWFDDIPPGGQSAWGDFAGWVQGPSAKPRASGAEFSDSWLLTHICEHEWLGNMWRPSVGGSWSLVSGNYHIHLGRALFMKPSMNIAIHGSTTSPFLPPSWPDDTVEVLTRELLRAVGPALQLLQDAGVPSEFYSVDPLALDYPPVFDTRKNA